MVTFGKNLRNARETKNLTQSEMANALGLSVAAYSHYENNYREPPLRTLKKISDILDISIDSLLAHITDTDNNEFEHAKLFWNNLGFEVTKLKNGIIRIGNKNVAYLSGYLFYKESDFIEKTTLFVEKCKPSPPYDLLNEFVSLLIYGLDNDNISSNFR